ncbi:predicted transcriptional regulator [Brachybacterium faecium DSM 4810]|mgnify:CR=1 FL=1|uniref:Predicted transcriptional regulator n=1 Tax=Brachybacterium faecium (strain ATCC 43885 / DSM 4810 / JCM 11609 / LMG 19847 / NBRC 14762 / NCIMB 9860 / 6-10) TaxID=446465 RepID=C7MBV5_BRAFD|nr:helix-turn-helix transcriptional regulator [Brachybacterium faecium]ACU85062.1 predicted transcriptional regulator [Brachybacterium faecium DSM 4810]HJG52295.1 helix-turn-helix transcriptional regulator [Brachybacterium faecium]
MPSSHRLDDRAPVFVISVAAELSGMHPQTLRQYDRLGLVIPQRTRGRGRRYSTRDIARLREIQALSQEDGINLAGIKRILELQDEVTALEDQLSRVRDTLETMTPAQRRVFSADRDGEISALRRGERPRRRSSGNALVVWRPTRRS